MTLEEFCKSIGAQIELNNAKKAVSILWYLDRENAGTQKNARELAAIIKEYNIGNPNPSQLDKFIRTTRCVYTKGGLFQIREDKKDEISSWVEDALVGIPEEISGQQQFLSEGIWKKTRGYIERVCVQLNGAYYHGYFDCAAVMSRRLVEILIIESYEELKREDEIKSSDGNYHMLGELINRANASGGLSLGMEAKKALTKIKKLGNRSAHNRRYYAKKPDLDPIRDELRICVEELLHLADLYPGT